MTSRERWQSAQAFERAYWQQPSWHAASAEQRTREWTRHLADLDLSISDFATKEILDVGCGPTGIAYFIDSRRNTGLDPLADIYKLWNGSYGKRIELVQSRAESMPFRDASFDAVFCINCADHCQSPAQVLSECARVLRPGGTFVFMVDLDSPLRKLHKLIKRNDRMAHPHSLTYGWVHECLAAAFTVQKECRDRDTFKPRLTNMRSEAYWDGLLYRATKSPNWMHHIWLSACRRS